jgi:hypothetical protein
VYAAQLEKALTNMEEYKYHEKKTIVEGKIIDTTEDL